MSLALELSDGTLTRILRTQNGTSFFDSWTFWNYDDPTQCVFVSLSRVRLFLTLTLCQSLLCSGTVSYQDSATSVRLHSMIDFLQVGLLSRCHFLSQWNEGLVSINSAGHAIMTVDQTQAVTGGRKSVRLHSTYIFNGGLILMDSHHMPWGCGVWPAWWSNGMSFVPFVLLRVDLRVLTIVPCRAT